MERAKNADKKWTLGSAAIGAALLFCGLFLLAFEQRVAAQATSEVRVEIYASTPSINVTAVEYYSENGQRYARVTAQTRYASEVSVELEGAVLETRQIDTPGPWTTHVFIVPLANDEPHQLIVRAVSGLTAIIAEDYVELQYEEPVVPPDDDDDDDSTDDDAGGSEGEGGGANQEDEQGGFWGDLFAPNTGAAQALTGPYGLFAVGAIMVAFVLVVIARQQRQKR